MTLTDSIRSISKQVIFIMTAHAIVYTLHFYARQKIDFMFIIDAYLPLLLILCLVPLLSSLFLLTQASRQSSIILLGSLPAELIYNIYTRFIASPYISNLPANYSWKIIYEVTYGCILVMEIVGFWLTLKIIKEFHKFMKQQSINSTNL